MMNDLLQKRPDIEAWLDRYEIKNYTLEGDETLGFIVNVAGDVILINKNLEAIRVQFGVVKGNFDCSYNSLISLRGAPQSVGKDFNVNHNRLRTLRGAPNVVGKQFLCKKNNLKNLLGCPSIVNGYLNCSSNQISSLEGAPKIVGGGFNCSFNRLTSLKHCPEVVQIFSCYHNQIVSLEYCPRVVTEGIFNCKGNHAFKNYNRNFKEIYKDHQEFLIQKEKNILSQIIDCHEKKAKSHKI